MRAADAHDVRRLEMLSPFVKETLLAITGTALLVCLVWALVEPGWSSATAALSSLAAVLAVLSDPAISRHLERIGSWKQSREGRLLSKRIKKRHQRKPDQVLSFALPESPDRKHEVASYLIGDTHGSGLIKAIVHRAPSADPYDIATVEGAKPCMKVVDIDSDGRPELVLDTVVGAHTHQVSVFTLNGLDRFEEVQGSPLFADFGPVELTRSECSGKYEITILRGSGAAGGNAKPVTYTLTDGALELVRGGA